MSATQADYKPTWWRFAQDLQDRILPIYMEHEKRFDPWGVHGRMHICRSVIFAEWMARFFEDNLAVDMDFYAIRIATAFHDSGRENNGIDLWEKDSSKNCYEYVRSDSHDPRSVEYASYVSSLIEKSGGKDPAKSIVQDADVLEIMRPCCGHGGLAGFKRKYLRFCGSADELAANLPAASEVREALILEAWKWIRETEEFKLRMITSPAYFISLLDKLDHDRRRFPLLSTLV